MTWARVEVDLDPFIDQPEPSLEVLCLRGASETPSRRLRGALEVPLRCLKDALKMP